MHTARWLHKENCCHNIWRSRSPEKCTLIFNKQFPLYKSVTFIQKYIYCLGFVSLTIKLKRLKRKSILEINSNLQICPSMWCTCKQHWWQYLLYVVPHGSFAGISGSVPPQNDIHSVSLWGIDSCRRSWRLSLGYTKKHSMLSVHTHCETHTVVFLSVCSPRKDSPSSSSS